MNNWCDCGITKDGGMHLDYCSEAGVVTKQSFSKNELVVLLDAVLIAEQAESESISQETLSLLRFKLIRLLEKIAVDTVNGDAPVS